MSLTNLKLERFRNLKAVDIKPSERFNLFYGQNGAGKTSLLESIYYLGLGRSFRTRLTQRIIQEDEDTFSIFAELKRADKTLPMGVQRFRDGSKQMKIDGEHVSSLAPLAKELPLQFMSTFSYRFFIDGPKVRRQFLDWIVFHVEHSFHSTWQSAQRVLKQRNAALKSQLPAKDLAIWDQELSRLSNTLDQQRSQLVAELSPIFSNLLEKLLPNYTLSLRYQRGWAKDEELGSVLKRHLRRDQQLGYTQYGPHRSDLQLFCGKTPAQDVLSQGQQKLTAYALHLAQGFLLKQHTGQSPLFLIDDLPSELDQEKRSLMAEILSEIDSQVFITGISEDDISALTQMPDTQLFHVEHGQISPCLSKK